MKTPLQVITDYKCPTNSYINAIQHFSDRQDLTLEQYQKGIQELIGLSTLPETESYHFAKTLFLYVVQETIRVYGHGLIPDMDAIYEQCIDKTHEFIENNPWSATRFNLNHGLMERDEFDEETGTIATKQKGAKKEVTEQIFKDLKSKGATRQDIIDAFVQQTGMSKAGATTYFHSLKKELGFREESADKKTNKTGSKQELAERLYQESTDKSKGTMITLFTEKLETSKLGAQTYFYACKEVCG